MSVKAPPAPNEAAFSRARAITSPRWVKRSIYVWRRLLRVRATPHEVALGCAVGIFAGCTPFLGFQAALAAALAILFRVSIPAAVAGSFVGNPLSWPAIWSASYVTGAYALGLDPTSVAEALPRGVDALGQSILTPTPQAIDAAVVTLSPILAPLIVGGMMIGALLAAGSYYPTRRAVRIFQMRRAQL